MISFFFMFKSYCYSIIKGKPLPFSFLLLNEAYVKERSKLLVQEICSELDI